MFGDEIPTAEVLEALRGVVPETVVSIVDVSGVESLIDVLVLSELCSSRGDARRTVASGGVRVNGVRVGENVTALPDDSVVADRFVLLQKGKRSRHLLVFG